MSFFDRITRGRLFFNSEKLPEQVIKFTFMDKSYILEEFSINFHQEINSKGRPDGMPVGGIMNLTFTETPDYYINEWMCRENILRDGEIRFLSGDLKVQSGAGLIILFKDAYCIDYRKNIHTLKGGLFTTLTVSPRIVKIKDEEFINQWKQTEDLPFYIRSGKS